MNQGPMQHKRLSDATLFSLLICLDDPRGLTEDAKELLKELVHYTLEMREREFERKAVGG